MNTKEKYIIVAVNGQLEWTDKPRPNELSYHNDNNLFLHEEFDLAMKQWHSTLRPIKDQEGFEKECWHVWFLENKGSRKQFTEALSVGIEIPAERCRVEMAPKIIDYRDENYNLKSKEEGGYPNFDGIETLIILPSWSTEALVGPEADLLYECLSKNSSSTTFRETEQNEMEVKEEILTEFLQKEVDKYEAYLRDNLKDNEHKSWIMQTTLSCIKQGYRDSQRLAQFKQTQQSDAVEFDDWKIENGWTLIDYNITGGYYKNNTGVVKKTCDLYQIFLTSKK